MIHAPYLRYLMLNSSKKEKPDIIYVFLNRFNTLSNVLVHPLYNLIATRGLSEGQVLVCVNAGRNPTPGRTKLNTILINARELGFGQGLGPPDTLSGSWSDVDIVVLLECVVSLHS